MNVFRARPEGVVASGLIANAMGSLLGSIAWVFFSPEAVFPVISQPGIEAILGLSFYAFLVGIFWVLAYAAPVMALMRRIGFGGPAIALLVGSLPALVAAWMDPEHPIGVLAVYGGFVSVAFCLFAYRGVFATRLPSVESSATTF